MLTLTGPTRLWEPPRLPFRLAADWPWTSVITDARKQLEGLPKPE